MKVCIITYADLGEKENLKTPTILPLIKKLDKEKVLHQVICRDKKNFYFKNTFAAVGFFVRACLYILKFFKPNLKRRQYEQNFFDFVASKKLSKADIVFIHPVVFPKTFSKAKKQGSIVVGITTESHPRYGAKIVQEEIERLDKIKLNQDNNFKCLVDQCDYIIALSDFVKKSYVKEGYPEDRVFKASTDVNIKKFFPKEKEDDKFRVLFVAKVLIIKGLHYLLDAWEKTDFSNAELLLLGDIPKVRREKYYSSIDKIKSIKSVEEVKDPVKYYQNASVFVLPTLTEGYSKVVAEAMACGLPVITTEAAGELIKDGENGFLVPFRDVDAIKDRLNFLYNNPEKIVEIGKKARESLLSKKSFGDEVYNFCKKILKNKNN